MPSTSKPILIPKAYGPAPKAKPETPATSFVELEDYNELMFNMDMGPQIPLRVAVPVIVPAQSPDDLNQWFKVVERSNYNSRPLTQVQPIKPQTGIGLVAHSLFYCPQQAGTSPKPLKENFIDKYPDIDKGEIFIMDEDLEMKPHLYSR